MKLILDNIIFFMQKVGGGSVHWIEIIKRLEENPKVEIVYIEPNEILNSNILYKDFRLKINLKIIKEKFNSKITSFLNFSKYSNYKYIYHSSYYRISKDKNAINVITIHDLIPELYFKGVKRFIHTFRKKNALNNADAIICVSKNTMNDLHRFYPNTINKIIEVIYNGTSDNFYKISPNDYLKNNKILFIGKRTEYKNFFFAVNVLKELKNYIFQIVGEPLNENEIKFLNNSNIKYDLLSGINDDKLNELYNQAYCLLYPSDYEGFGIPVIEAMKCGCPILALNKSSVKEIAKNVAILLDDLNVNIFVENILKLEDLEYRKKIMAKGIEHSANFNWDDISEKYYKFYHKIYNEKII